MIDAAIKNAFKGKMAFYMLLIALALLDSSCAVFQRMTPENDEKRIEQKKNAALIKKYEDILGTRINIKKSLLLYKAIDKWIGVPYRHGSMTRKGTDCSGFTCSIYEEVYHIKLHRDTEEQYQKDIRRIGKRRLKEGDLVFFDIEDGKKVSHVGIYLGNHKFAHASVKKGVCISDLEEKYYQDHFKHAGRVQKTRLSAGILMNGV